MQGENRTKLPNTSSKTLFDHGFSTMRYEIGDNLSREISKMAQIQGISEEALLTSAINTYIHLQNLLDEIDAKSLIASGKKTELDVLRWFKPRKELLWTNKHLKKISSLPQKLHCLQTTTK